MIRAALALVLVLACAGIGATTVELVRGGRCCTGRCAAPPECAPPEVLATAPCEQACVVKLEAEPAPALERASSEVRAAEPVAVGTPVAPKLVAAQSARKFDESQFAQKQALLLSQGKPWPAAQLKELKLANANVELVRKAALRDPALLAQLKRSGPTAAVAPVRQKTKPGFDPAQKLAPLK